jgi:hypothetical protein
VGSSLILVVIASGRLTPHPHPLKYRTELMVVSASTRYCYRVDQQDTLTWVDTWWLAFARENGATDLTQESVLGRLLWDFVEGRETRRLFEAIHQRVRSSGQAVILPFRCDSPLLKRLMRLTVSSEPAGQLLYESVLVRVEPRLPLRLLDPQQPRSEAVLTLCSCCLKTLIENTGWLELEEAVAMLHLLEQEPVPQLRYTICAECRLSMSRTPENGNAA